uniref:THAP domain-containing protein 1 n=1 Tax=Poecilia mexicana TaxID=48701 RepID=A0A3B3XYL5_9TELE
MRRKCIFGCPGDYPLFKLPKDETVLKQWLDFIIQNNTPTKKNWHICARHFTDDSFLNKREFDSGLITRLSLKDDAIPTLRTTNCFSTVHTASRGTDAKQSLPHFLSTPVKSALGAQSKRPRMEVGKEEDDDFRISSPASQDSNYYPGDTVTNFSDLM